MINSVIWGVDHRHAWCGTILARRPQGDGHAGVARHQRLRDGLVLGVAGYQAVWVERWRWPAGRGFARVIGVELSTELVDEGRRILKDYENCEFVNQDATMYNVPPNSLVFYLGNPFGGRTLEDTLKRIAASVRQHPCPHLILGYNNVQKLPHWPSRLFGLASSDEQRAGQAQCDERPAFHARPAKPLVWGSRHGLEA
jgi:hypothetical protein